MLTVRMLTDPGSAREINEDAMLWDAELGVIAVADGMGGHNAGEVASQLALDALRSFLRKSAVGDDFTWPFGVDSTISFNANRLLTAMKIANRRVFKASEERAEYVGMGTTLVAAIVEGSQLIFSSVGDSRVYELRGDTWRQLSRDDSWIVMLSEESGVAASTLEAHPMRHVLTNVIGARPEVEVRIGEVRLEDGQEILLCTDGLHGAMPDDLIASTLKSEPDLERAATRLVRMSLERDGKDNVTVLLARYDGRN